MDYTVNHSKNQQVICEEERARPGTRSVSEGFEPGTLSYPHIRPFLEYVEGGSLLKSCKGLKMEAVGGGERGAIRGFSDASRRRMLGLIASIKRDAELPDFMTITYPDKFPTVEQAKRDLKIFTQRLQRAFPRSGMIWKLEPQERGAPHYHCLVWGCDTSELMRWTVENWFEIAGQGDNNAYLFLMGALPRSKPCVQKVYSWKGVWSYAAKYIGKTFEVAEWGKQWTGRFWGVINRENIPFGEMVRIAVPLEVVHKSMRYQRRYMAMRSRYRLNSLRTFCDADSWINNLMREYAREVTQVEASISTR